MPTAYSENLTLVTRCQQGDPAAAEALIKLNRGLVSSVARRYLDAAGCLEFEDLTQEGNLGLLRAAQDFDPSRGVGFITYSHWWVRQAITRAITTSANMIRLPDHVQTRRRSRGEQTFLPVLSLDLPEGEEGEDHLGDLLPDPSESVEDLITREWIAGLLSRLSPREQQILIRRCGFLDGEPQSFREAGRAVNLSPEGCRQAEAKALLRLRAIVLEQEPCLAG